MIFYSPRSSPKRAFAYLMDGHATMNYGRPGLFCAWLESHVLGTAYTFICISYFGGRMRMARISKKLLICPQSSSFCFFAPHPSSFFSRMKTCFDKVPPPQKAYISLSFLIQVYKVLSVWRRMTGVEFSNDMVEQ